VEEGGIQTAPRTPIENAVLAASASVARMSAAKSGAVLEWSRMSLHSSGLLAKNSKARRGASVPRFPDLSEEVVDRVQAEKAGDNKIDRHRNADDAGRDQQKHTRGQGDEWQEGAGCIGMHPASIPDSMALG